MRFITGILLAALSTLAADADAHDTERYLRIVTRDRTGVNRLLRSVSVARVSGDTVFAYAGSGELPALRSQGYDPVELVHPDSRLQHVMAASPAGLAEWDQYPTYQAYLQMMRDFAAGYPSLCRLDTIGLSAEGRLLLALKISDNVSLREDEPQCFYTSSMHGNELVGYVLMLRLADYLLKAYGQNTAEGIRVTALLNSIELWINPLFNPDGTYRLGGDTTISNARRFNVNGTDLNRSFPDRIADSVNSPASREPETAAMMQWTQKHNFSLSANFHCGAQVVNYPWDNGSTSGTPSICPDDEWFVQLSLSYAMPNPDLQAGGFTNGITNGCAWYSLFGGRQDWMYVWQGGREVTVELSNANIPAGSMLPAYWNNNRESLLAYLEHALRGIRGVVTNSATGLPVKAQIDLLDDPGLPVFSDASVGDYHRLLLPGTYSLLVRSAGFRPDTLHGIVVTAGPATRVDVALQPLTVQAAQEEFVLPDRFSLGQNFPNPFNPVTTIEYAVPAAADRHSGSERVHLAVFDLLGREVAVLVDEWQVPGKHRVQFGAEGLPSGAYVYRLRAGMEVHKRVMMLIR